jgi:hypothetical protein
MCSARPLLVSPLGSDEEIHKNFAPKKQKEDHKEDEKKFKPRSSLNVNEKKRKDRAGGMRVNSPHATLTPCCCWLFKIVKGASGDSTTKP